MRELAITNFKSGVINAIEAQSIPDGAASDSLNWITKGDKIELRRGSQVIGAELSGTGRVPGLHTSRKANGTEVKFKTCGRFVEYFDSDAEAWKGVGMGSSIGIIDSYSEANQDSFWAFNAAWRYVGQSFYSGLGGQLQTVKFYLQRINSPAGDLYAEIYAMTGTYGTDSKPTGSALATSDAVVASSVSSSFELVTFTFTGGQQIILDPNTHYCVVVRATGTDGPNNIRIGYDASSPTHDGNYSASTDGITWVTSLYHDTIFYVYAYRAGEILPEDADGEDIIFQDYVTNAGNQVWFSSPNSSLYKIMVANPGDYTDMYDGSKNFKGYIKISQNRMWLWGRTTDKTGVYGSYIDTAAYTTVTAETRHSGDGATLTFSGTLAFKAGGPKRTCFAVTITDGTETFTDDYSGNLTGSAGGTGTINYTTGEYSVTFAAAPAVGVNNITATYQYENSNSNGISDFTKSSPRLAGQGFIFRQDDGGGNMKNIFTLGDTEYCIHEFKTWALTLTATDTNATNDIFRQNVGIPYLRAAVSSSVGIFYIDVTDNSKPLFRKLILNPGSSDVVPKTVTLNLDLSGYSFDQCAMWEWNDYILFSGKTSDSTVNNRLFCYHKTWGSMDILDYYPSVMAIGNGTLISGESISNNVVTLFSGFDDSDSLINNYWEGNISDLRISGRLKKVKKLILEGEIQSGQGYNVYISTDHGGYALVGSISGDGTYVDKGNAITVGSNTVGSKEVGGGGDGVEAYHYKTALNLALDKFEDRQLKIEATGIGYVSISKIVDHDIRLYAAKLPSKYR